ncbi:hypothetical protein SEMRO_956_G224490.1 [Seminavis robusta]|uniref:Uncharacterized protein n=1 Tax=Seminavis robusta TaxID=568900 RepID=A0A9N8EHF6_9STRA|nr:hypothetical protein SEMRO_956_G224490.1 [Seminavis robusta]|eukprot:Sro956_g224490.1 n/a (172) ;mRNA; r:10291-10898
MQSPTKSCPLYSHNKGTDQAPPRRLVMDPNSFQENMDNASKRRSPSIDEDADSIERSKVDSLTNDTDKMVAEASPDKIAGESGSTNMKDKDSNDKPSSNIVLTGCKGVGKASSIMSDLSDLQSIDSWPEWKEDDADLYLEPLSDTNSAKEARKEANSHKPEGRGMLMLIRP